jgi:hypothetical protein
MVSISAAILTLLLALAPLALAGTEEDGGVSAPPVSLPAGATDTTGGGGGSPPPPVSAPTVSGTVEGGDDGDSEDSAPEESAPSEDSGSEESGDNGGDGTESSGPGSHVPNTGALVKPVAVAGGVLGLTAVGLMLFRRL